MFCFEKRGKIRIKRLKSITCNWWHVMRSFENTFDCYKKLLNSVINIRQHNIAVRPKKRWNLCSSNLRSGRSWCVVPNSKVTPLTTKKLYRLRLLIMTPTVYCCGMKSISTYDKHFMCPQIIFTKMWKWKIISCLYANVAATAATTKFNIRQNF